MSMAKCRGKSMLNDEPEATAPTTTTTTTNTAQQPLQQQQQQPQLQQQQQQTYLPQTSLLKIEPFVPSFNQRLRRRPIGRSYSTLSNSVIPKRNRQQQQPQQQSDLVVGAVLECPPTPQQQQQQQLKRSYAAAAQLRQQQQQQRLPNNRGRGGGAAISRQRSKSTSSSAASNPCRPATAAAVGASAANATPTTCVGSTGGTLVSGAIVTPQPNGICRIQRLPKEREELPDRINYDRRGLTAIPIFEQEPNLRLLSLQHNLINIFHIPKELPTPPPPPLQPPPPARTAAKTETNNNYNAGREQAEQKRHTALHGRLTRAATNAGNLYSNGQRQSPKSSSPNSSPLTTQALAINGGQGGGGRSKLVKRNSLLQRSGYNFAQAQLPPPPAQQQHLRLRFGLEKSKSFVANYGPAPRSLQAMKQQHQLMQRRALLKASGGMAACDSGDNLGQNYSELGGEEEEEKESSSMASQLEQLSIKNKQLSLSANYGIIFHQLVFLDLYDNQIERIANLDGLPALTVLLLGKNRITDIGGLGSLGGTLRVLDLHGNKLTSISNRIHCLPHLKSLNLAGNQIRQINQQDFQGLRCLKELNLKRNKIKRINGFQHLVALERLWLCHNELHKVDDMASIARASKLLEVTIENNPVSLAGDCVSFLVSYLPLLQSLSQMPITEQVRRAALGWRQHKEQAEAQAAHGTTEAYHSIRREEVISNARTNWELLRSQQTVVQSAGQRAMRSPKKLTSELAKINESNETPAETSEEQLELEQPEQSAVGVLEELQALIKLPPIASKKPEDDASSEGSSLGPNVDSCSSCYSSDNEAKHIDENSNKLTTEPEPEKQMTPATPTPSPSPPALTLTPPAAAGQELELAAAMTPPPATTVTLPLPTASSGSSSGRPASSRQRSRAAPITQLGFHYNNNNSKAGNCKRYMTGSLVRAQTVVGGGGGGSTTSNSSSSHSGRAKQQQQQQQANPSASSVMAVSLVAPPAGSGSGSASVAPAKAAAASSAGSSQSQSQAQTTAAIAVSASKTSAAEREREQGGDYLIEICGRYLNIYGQGALRFIDKQWNPAKANDVHTLNFSYINFNSIVAVLSRVKVRFPHAEHFVFRETNISCLGQLNALAELQGIGTLSIDSEGNSVTAKPLWRPYTIYRLSHWGLKQLNGQEVAEAEVEAANAMYAGLSDLVLWSMPDVMLQPLLARLRLDETCTASKLTPKEWLMRADNKSLRLVVGKEALQWKKAASSSAAASQNFPPPEGASLAPVSARDRGRQHFALLLEHTCSAVEKLHKLETLWPSMLLDIVRNTLLDYAQLDVYLRNLMCELMK